jgi:uncharacterized protein YjbJ (UPF0337 family)
MVSPDWNSVVGQRFISLRERLEKQRDSGMKRSKDEVIGKAKQVVAEIVGDGKLQEEGKEQEDKAKREPNEVNPFGGLNHLT